ncbi:MAG TPA: hypothetical protein VMJ10_07975, partial [Kofleriaceae bacterium]|nr:hypothetical protein [Kofleriaceae bacterium]
FALAVWTWTLAVAWVVLRLGAPAWTLARGAMVALSIVAVFAPRAGWLERRLPKPGPDVVLVAIAAAAIAARALGPHGVLAKLALAYALVLAGHAALRLALGRGPEVAPERSMTPGTRTTLLHRARLLAALAIAAGAVAAYDTGVALAIGGVGLALSMIVAGHDASYDATVADRIGLLEREHARLVAVHGAIALAVAVGAIAVAVLASDREWLERAAPVACQAPLVAAAMFGFAAVLARAHRRAWLPHVAAAVAAIALWAARGDVLERATAGHGVAADRVAAVVDPGYALLRDQRRFAATASAWREAALPARTADAIDPPSAPLGVAARPGGAGAIDRVDGEGLFGARIVDPGVIHSVENDYLPVLVARETGVAGIAETTALLVALVAMAGAFAAVGARHASRAQRGRWLVAVVLGVLCVYQPLASLGVLPLTGISWPGLGIDSPSDLWLFVIALVWCALAEPERDGDDERVRATRRVIRARRIAVAALATSALAGGVVVARSAAMALARVPAHDARLAAALRYASTVSCPWHDHDGAPSDVVPVELGGEVDDTADSGVARFDRELRAEYRGERDELVAALPACTGVHGHWQLERRGATCVATFRGGAPELHLELAPRADAWHATCAVAVSDIAASALRGPTRADRGPRVRVVAAPIGAAARDAGELVAGARVDRSGSRDDAEPHGISIVRLRAGAPALELASASPGLARAGRVTIAPGVTVEVAGARIVLRGDAELYLASDGAWHHVARAPEVALDRLALVAAGPPEHRVVVQVRPAAEPLLADDVEHARRTYPYGSALPELGWVSPFEVEHSLGLDGWIHAALDERAAAPAATCGALSPPAIARDRVCAPSPLDGVLECKLALQPELALALGAVADRVLAEPQPLTGHATVPTRAAYVVVRGDTGELLAQGERVPGKPALAYAPVDRVAEAELIRLREQHGESDRERVEWNLPIAVGSTFKAILARAAERAFPDQLHGLALTAAGHASGCRAHRGTAVDPLLGHCPPSSLAGDLTSADAHDFLGRSPNWFQAALGLIGLGLPAGHFHRGATELSFADVAASDLASWPTTEPLAVDDATGPIVHGHTVVVDGLRRTPLWQHTEALLGRPLCTLGDRASCERAADRADVCAARALPVAHPSRDLRYLVALGPDRVDLYADDTAHQTRVPVREYFQLLRGAGVHSIGSLAQLADAFARVVYDPGAGRLAASWFPAPAVGAVPTWSCTDRSAARATTVLGAGGGLCAVVQDGGTAHAGLAPLFADARVAIYGAKTGTTDSLAAIAQRPAACAAWNESHVPAAQLACGKRPADDSLLVLAFGVTTPHGTIPLVLALQLQRAGTGAAAHAAPAFVDAIARYLTE